MSSTMNKGSAMSSFAVGDRVNANSLRNYSAAEPGTGTVTEISTFPGDPWPVTVRLDSGIDWVYAFAELERSDEAEHINTFDAYQVRTQDTAVYPEQGSFGGAMYAIAALNEEAGEVAGKVAKFIRKSSGWDELLTYGVGYAINTESYPEDLVLAVSKELGDVLYQAARVAEEFGLNLSDVATENIVRLADRKKRDVIIGDGEDR